MKCDLLDCCQFIKNNMAGLPKAAEYMKKKICNSQFQVCGRYRTFKGLATEEVPFYLDPRDVEEMKELEQCLARKHDS